MFLAGDLTTMSLISLLLTGTLLCLRLDIIDAAICAGSDVIDRVHIVGLLEINPTADCSQTDGVATFALSLALAAEYVVDYVNSHGNSDLAVKGVSYEFRPENICSNRSLATRTAAINLPKTLWTKQSVCFSESPIDEQQESLLLGFLGPAYSSNTKYVAQLMNNTNIPVITPAATLAEFSDKSQYYSLTRTATSDDKQSKALIQAAMKMEWTYVLLIHTDDNYGRQGAKSLQEEGDLQGLCFSDTIEVKLHPTDSSHYSEIARRMRASSATGIIYFGLQTAAIAIIDHFLDVQPITKEKVILSSDGIGTNQEIVEKLSSQASEKLKLITIAPYNTDNHLQEYIEQRLSGARNGSDQVNQFIRTFKQQCDSRQSCSYESLARSVDSTQATINAMVALLYAFRQTHQRLCGASEGVCAQLSDSVTFYPTLLKNMKNTTISTNLSDATVRVSLNADGELSKDTPTPAFTLNVAHRSSKTYQTVAEYHHNDTWTYKDESLLYRGGSRCITDCSKCKKKTAPYVYRRSDKSKYIIVGTAAVNDEQDQHECGQVVTQNGFVMMTSFYYAVEQINSITGIEFSTLFIDTCYAKLGTLSIMNQIFREEKRAYLNDSSGHEWPIEPNDFVVFIGDSASGVSLVLQTYLSLYNIPQISYRSTSTLLSDSLRYPMFLRNVPSDDEQARLMVEIIQKLNWQEVGLIHSTTIYGQSGARLVQQYAAEKGVCISYLQMVSNTEKSIAALIENIRQTGIKSTLPVPIIIFAEEGLIRKILGQLRDVDRGWTVRGNIFIGSETWNNLQEVIETAESIVYGSLTFSFSDSVYNLTRTNGTNAFQQYLDTQKPDNNKDNPLFIRFWQQHFECYLLYNSLPSSSRKCDNSKLSLADANAVKTPLQYDDVVGKHVIIAGLSVAYSIREATDGEKICRRHNDHIDCSNLFDSATGRQEFFRLLKETKIPQRVGSERKTYSPFLPSGDGMVNYKVYNIQKRGQLAKYQEVYKIVNGEITRTNRLAFYRNGYLIENIQAECQRCQCLVGTGLKQEQMSSSSEPPQTWSGPNWLLPLLVLILLFIIVLVMAAILYVACIRKHDMKTRRKYSQFLMQQYQQADDHYTDVSVPPPLPASSVSDAVSTTPTSTRYVAEPNRPFFRTSPLTQNGLPPSRHPADYLEFHSNNTTHSQTTPTSPGHGITSHASQVSHQSHTPHNSNAQYEVPESANPSQQASRMHPSTSFHSNQSRVPTPQHSLQEQTSSFTSDPKMATLDERAATAIPSLPSASRRSPAGEECNPSNLTLNHSDSHHFMAPAKTVDD